MTENNTSEKKPRSKMSLKSLRLSLKYRPELLKLILKMRLCIRRRNSLIKSLKHRLRQLETDNANSKSIEADSTKQTLRHNDQNQENKHDVVNSQTHKSTDANETAAGWNITENGETEKSIADQVKEVAQSALQDTGMVYVESAGMYYDYKTGYYYNSELGLYYHTETGCYYYYSEDKKFVFHSYPDMSKVNSSLIAHQNKKARKLKRERMQEDDINNLTKHLSQEKEEDGGNPKKSRKSKKAKKEKYKKSKGEKEKKIKEEKEKKPKKEKKTKHEEEKENKIDIKEMEITVKHKEKIEEKEQIDSKDLDQSLKVENTDCSDDIKNQDSQILTTGDSNAMDICEATENNSVKEASITKDINDATKTEDTKQIEDENKNSGDEVKTEILEEGECSDTESEESEPESESDSSTSTVSDEDCIAKHHPPCMRVIVRDTTLPKLKVGSLFLITKDGGTIGREGDHHAVLLKDHNVSRNHLDIRYDMTRKTYQATDLGSKNGSILNGVRMSESQEVSSPLDVLHGSTIQLGETKLLCHIHPGHATCGQCEPGLLMQVEEEKKVAYTRTVNVKKQYELELARLKNIYAPQRLAIEEKPYNDRAQARRVAVGSTNHAEKTQASDLDTSIEPDNKGFKLMQKMGWSKGEGLGKDSQGDTEPVPLTSNKGKAGLGTAGAVASPSNAPTPRVIKNNIASGTMRLAARTNMLKPPAKAFQDEDDDELE